MTVRDPLLGARLGRLAGRRDPDEHLLSFRDEGVWHHLTSALVSERFHALAGDGFSVKDLRTWAATVAAAVAAAEALAAGGSRGEAERGQRIKDAVADAAATLGDTVAVARNSYVDPRLLSAYEQTGRTVGRCRGPVLQHSSAVRRRVERQLLEILEHSEHS